MSINEGKNKSNFADPKRREAIEPINYRRLRRRRRRSK